MKKYVKILLHACFIMAILFATFMVANDVFKVNHNGIPMPNSANDQDMFITSTWLCLLIVIVCKIYLFSNIHNKKIMIFTAIVEMVVVFQMFRMLNFCDSYFLLW